jgi:hypothetical protein
VTVGRGERCSSSHQGPEDEEDPLIPCSALSKQSRGIWIWCARRSLKPRRIERGGGLLSPPYAPNWGQKGRFGLVLISINMMKITYLRYTWNYFIAICFHILFSFFFGIGNIYTGNYFPFNGGGFTYPRTCDQCHSVYNSKQAFSFHKKKCSSVALLICESCYKIFKTKRVLNQHKKNMPDCKNLEIPQKCHRCLRFYRNRNTFYNHKASCDNYINTQVAKNNLQSSTNVSTSHKYNVHCHFENCNFTFQ